MKAKFSAFGVLMLAFALFAAQGMAQVTQGTITGVVTDPSGAVVPAATVTLLNVNTNVRTVTSTSSKGNYVFNFLVSDTYTVTVEKTGFHQFIQQNIVVMAASTITVNATLTPGAVRQVVTVTGTPPQLQTNTSDNTVNLNSTLSDNTPRYDRNPFKLTLLAPEATNTRSEMEPYLSWSANSVDLGGGTNLENNLLVNGSTVDVGHKFTYPPNMDDVQETTVEQNGTGAQYGHSAGGVINVTTKSGTDQWHGDVMYLGRYPWLNAIYNRTTFPVSPYSTRQNMTGGSLGGPILKNKLFNFASFEFWDVNTPGTYTTTMPTTAQRSGDFSTTYDIDGSVAQIYNPFTSVYNPATGQITRTQFPGNIIPASDMDPVTSKLMANFWAPNGPGVNITGADNFQVFSPTPYDYYNFSDRVDYDLGDKWKFMAYAGYYTTTTSPPNVTPNDSELYVPAGTRRKGHIEEAQATYMLNPTSVLNFHFSYDTLVDQYDSPTLGGCGWCSIWPNSNWYEAYYAAEPTTPVYFPNLNIGGNGFGGSTLYWNQRPHGEDFNADYSHMMGSHYLQAGIEWRRTGGYEYIEDAPYFDFESDMTANTSISPNTLLYGNGFASFLTGGLENNSLMVAGPAIASFNQYAGIYIQDNWKVNHRLTVNLGLRDEYETPWYGVDTSRGLNLNGSVPQMVASPPIMPAAATSIEPAGFYSGDTNGLWQWASPGQGMWNAPDLALAPRAGFALMIDRSTVLRMGYARYIVPSEYNFTSAPVPGFEDVNFVEPPYFGMVGYQVPLGTLEGVPQETFSNPFPSSTNPLVPIPGPAGGTNVGRGGESLMWFPNNFKKAYNDRLDINLQRELPWHIMGSFTWFFNFGHELYNKELNAINPELEVKYQTALDVTEPNPFYKYLSPTLNPYGYYVPTTTLSNLMVPYPQYGGLYEIGVCCAGELYSEPQIQFNKQFSNGLTFNFGFVHIFSTLQENSLNVEDEYLNDLVWQDSSQPRNHMDLALVWELPVGRGKPLLSSSSKAVNALVGGWSVSPVLQYISGDYPQFSGMIVTGSPCVGNSSPTHWFNTSVFQPYPANTFEIQENPVQFSCITGPSFWDLDASLMKNFHLFERFNAQLKITAYNATNHLNLGDPDTTVTDSTFGEALFQGAPTGGFNGNGQTGYELTTGRQVELGFKLTW